MAKTRNINVTEAPYNAAADGRTDDRVAIQAAIDEAAAAGGGCVYFPRGTYLIGAEPGAGAIGGLQLRSNVLLQGEAPRASVLKLADSTNRNLIYGPSNVDALWGSGSTGGIENWSLLNIELDGNRANNRSGSGIWIYGFQPVVQNLYIHDIAENGWRTEWGVDAGPLLGMEGTIYNVRIDTCGQHGFWFSGPHDSIVNDVIVTDPSQAGHNAYDAFRLDGTVYSRFFALHCWHRSIVTNRARYGLHDAAGGNEFIACQFEGTYSANVYLSGQGSIFEACRFFAPANGVNIMVRSTENVIRGSLGGPLAGAPDCKGVVLGETGDWVSANVIDIHARFQAAGAVDFTHSSGGNSVRVRGFQPTGTLYLGTPNPTDDVDLMMTDAGGGTVRQTPGGERYTSGFLSLSQTSGITAAGSTQADATPLPDSSAVHVTGTAAAAGVRLPHNSTPGKFIYVHNSSADVLEVYPAPGQRINNLAANSPFFLGPDRGATFIYDSDRWMASSSA